MDAERHGLFLVTFLDNFGCAGHERSARAHGSCKQSATNATLKSPLTLPRSLGFDKYHWRGFARVPNLKVIGFDAAEDCLPRYVELTLNVEPPCCLFVQFWQCAGLQRGALSVSVAFSYLTTTQFTAFLQALASESVESLVLMSGFAWASALPKVTRLAKGYFRWCFSPGDTSNGWDRGLEDLTSALEDHASTSPGCQ